MKKIVILVVTLLLVSTLFICNSFAQDYTKWHLPDGAIMRLGKGGINDIKFSPDGSRLAIASDIGVWIYDAKTGTEISLIKVRPRGVNTANTIAFAPDGNTLAVGNWVLGGAVELWDVNTGELQTVLNDRIGRVKDLKFSPDGKMLTCASWFRYVEYYMWEVESGREVSFFTGDQDALNNGFALSPDANYVASAERQKVLLWDANTKNLRHTLDGSAWTLAFSPDSTKLVGGSTLLKQWDTETGNELSTFKNHTRNVEEITFSPDGKTFASGDTGGKIVIWYIDSTNKKVDENKNTLPNLIRSIRGKKVENKNEQIARILSGHTLNIEAIDYSADGKRLVSGSEDGTAIVWDIETGNKLLTIYGHTGPVTELKYINDSQTLLCGTYDGIIRSLNVESLSSQLYQTKPPWHAWDMAFSKDGKTVASGCWGEVRLWNTDTQEFYEPLGKQSEFVKTLAYSPDEKLLGSGHWKGKVMLWDVAKRELYKTLDSHTEDVSSVTFSPDGKWFASGSEDGTVHIWNLDTMTKTPLLFNQDQGIESLKFTPDSSILIIARWNGEIQLWDANTHQHIDDFIGARGTPKGLEISPDGKMLITGLHRGLIRIWNVETRSLFYEFKTGDATGPTEFAFSPDGKTLVSGSSDGTVLLWDWERILSLP